MLRRSDSDGVRRRPPGGVPIGAIRKGRLAIDAHLCRLEDLPLLHLAVSSVAALSDRVALLRQAHVQLVLLGRGEVEAPQRVSATCLL